MTTIISPDLHIIDSDGLYRWSPDRVAAAWDRCYHEFEEALTTASSAWLTIGVPGSGKTTWINGEGTRMIEHEAVIFDATLCKRIARRPLLELARRANKPICGAVFFTPLITALRRNTVRAPERRVPYDSLTAMLKSFEAEPPTLDEGFSTLFAIRSKT